MATQINSNDVVHALRDFSSTIDSAVDRVAMILAAGHGKRIRSERPKMLHRIWGVPTVIRVAQAAEEGLGTGNQVIVVGNKALEVSDVLGRRSGRLFVYQGEQRGTGDAVRLGQEPLSTVGFAGTIYVFPGDMGLLDSDVVREFDADFRAHGADMMVLTAMYQGDSEDNQYGRILRVPKVDASGAGSADDVGKVIAIMEHRDIVAMSPDDAVMLEFRGRSYCFTRQTLVEIREFNTGVYGFRAAPLRQLISELQPNNVQKELYVTDLIALFNRHGLTVRSSCTSDAETVLAFNDKAVLKAMEGIARTRAYERLKDIVMIEDKDDFFIADNVIAHILELDSVQAPLDIIVGKGVSISGNVRLGRGVILKDRVVLKGTITLEESVKVYENVIMRTFPGQAISVGPNTELLPNDIIQGNTTIGAHCRVESGVRITGSDDYPTVIGDNALIKGTTYIFGCRIDPDVLIEHSVLKRKHVEGIRRKDGTMQPVRWILPLPEGLDSITPLAAAPLPGADA